MAQRRGPREPLQGGLPHLLCACFRPPCTRWANPGPVTSNPGSMADPCLQLSVSLRLRWLWLKFQLLWGHLALFPTNGPSPKSQRLLRTQVSWAREGDWEKPQPTCSPQVRSDGSTSGSQPQGTMERDPGPSLCQAQPPGEPGVAQTRPGPRGERRGTVNQNRHLPHPRALPAHRNPREVALRALHSTGALPPQVPCRPPTGLSKVVLSSTVLPSTL